jgi:hypothetical protein
MLVGWTDVFGQVELADCVHVVLERGRKLG